MGRLLLCWALGCGASVPALGRQTDVLCRESGGGHFEISTELRQRRTTAGAGMFWRLEVLTAGLGPAARVLKAGPRDAVPGGGPQEVEVEVEEAPAPVGLTLSRPLDRPCCFGSFSASSLVSTTMSRQLPTLRGRSLFATRSPSTETPGCPFLFAPPGAFRRTDPSPRLLLPPDARLSEDEKSVCRPRREESSKMASIEQLLLRGLREAAALRLAQLPPKRSPTPPAFSAAERD